jgi:virginiamycin A acetyltransferase
MIRKLMYILRLLKFKSQWRKMNKNNFTYPRSIFPLEVVTVGSFSYGALNVEYYGDPKEKLQIGFYVSIASDVKFILGGNHKFDVFMTYPLRSYLIDKNIVEAITKGPIIIGDDVWIGCNSIILSGIKIGQGAIVAAGSVVTKDVPPYAIVGGSPAQIIRYRFEQTVIDRLTKINLAKIETQKIIDNLDLFNSRLNRRTISKIEKILNSD